MAEPMTAPQEPSGGEGIGDFQSLLNFLRADEGDSITLLSDNPDFNGQPNNAVECNGGWTDRKDRRFTGDTLVQAVTNAAIAKAVETGQSAPTPPSASGGGAVDIKAINEDLRFNPAFYRVGEFVGSRPVLCEHGSIDPNNLCPYCEGEQPYPGRQRLADAHPARVPTREEVARHLCGRYARADIPVPWERLSEYGQEYWLKEADAILALFHTGETKGNGRG